MAKRERLPEPGTPEVPQGIMGSVGSVRGRMRGRSLLETMPLARALTTMQEKSNERLREQLVPVLAQAGRQAERRRLAQDPDAPVPELSPADESLFQINAIYQAIYDTGRAQVFGAQLVQEHARVLYQKRTTPPKTAHLGRYGEVLPYDPELPGEGGFLYNPDAFAEFSRALEKSALEAIAEDDPTGRVYEFVAPLLSELHAQERERAEADYATYVRARGKEATDAAIAEATKAFSHNQRSRIAQGAVNAFNFFLTGFKDALNQFLEMFVDANPALAVYYPGKVEEIKRQLNDKLTMEFWDGIVDQARTDGQDALLVQMATWINTDEANILFDKENMAVARERLDAARDSRLNEWLQVTEQTMKSVRWFGSGGTPITNRQGVVASLFQQIREADAIVPGRQFATNAARTGWTAQQLRIDHAARGIEYLLSGIQHGFSVDADGNVETLDLTKVLPYYVPIYERLWTFTNPQGVIDELTVGIPIDEILAGNLTPAQRDAFNRMKLEGHTHYKPMLVGAGATYAENVLEDIKTQRRQAFQFPGNTAELTGGAGAPPFYQALVTRNLDSIVTGSTDHKKVFYDVYQTLFAKALVSGRINKGAFGSPMTGLSSTDAAVLNRLLVDAAVSPNKQTLHGISAAELAWGCLNQALSAVQDARTELGKELGAIPPPIYADPRLWEVLLVQDNSNKPLIRRVQAAALIAGLNGQDNNYAKAMFIGALEFEKVGSAGVIEPLVLNAAITDLQSSAAVQTLAATYAGGELDRAMATRSIAEAILGWALKDVSILSEEGEFDSSAYQQKADELLAVVDTSIMRIDGDRDMQLNLHGSMVGSEESKKTKLAIALPHVLANASIVNALGSDVSMNRFAHAVPMLQQIGGKEYIRFFERGVPMRLGTDGGELRELLVDVTAIADADISESFFGSAKLDGETPSAESGKWTRFLRFREDDGSIVSVR